MSKYIFWSNKTARHDEQLFTFVGDNLQDAELAFQQFAKLELIDNPHVSIEIFPSGYNGYGSLQAARLLAAENAFTHYDFGPNDVLLRHGSWQADDPNDEYTRLLTMDGIQGNYRCGFIVRFQPGTATVTEAYPGDSH